MQPTYDNGVVRALIQHVPGLSRMIQDAKRDQAKADLQERARLLKERPAVLVEQERETERLRKQKDAAVVAEKEAWRRYVEAAHAAQHAARAVSSHSSTSSRKRQAIEHRLQELAPPQIRETAHALEELAERMRSANVYRSDSFQHPFTGQPVATASNYDAVNRRFAAIRQAQQDLGELMLRDVPDLDAAIGAILAPVGPIDDPTVPVEPLVRASSPSRDRAA